LSRYLTFHESIEYLEDFYHQPLIPTAKTGLARAAFLLERVRNPHLAFRSIHVTGSCGKGSTTTMIGSILQAAGLRTGYFRSPHLCSYTERIAIDGVEISTDTWEWCFNRLLPTIEAMRANSLPGYCLGRPALFEVLFALMALYFAEEGVEWAAVEAGLGGRLDATNLLPSAVAVITNVSLEHTQVLGDTVAAIAREKAAIIKAGSYAVTASHESEALSIIHQRAAEVGAPLIIVGQDVLVHVGSEQLTGQEIVLFQRDRQPQAADSIAREDRRMLRVCLPLGGTFQAENAATAYAAALALQEHGISVSDEAITVGLESVTMPGRFEVISYEPLIILDGAHNPAAATELRKTIMRLVPNRRTVLLFAAMSDKDLSAMARELSQIAATVVATRAPGTGRAADPSALADSFRANGSQVIVEEDAGVALMRARAEVGAQDLLLIAGSLYLVGYVRSLLLADVRSSYCESQV
jgi:dihydrofolate synthase/folylpolyglutamate synthase